MCASKRVTERGAGTGGASRCRPRTSRRRTGREMSEARRASRGRTARDGRRRRGVSRVPRRRVVLSIHQLVNAETSLIVIASLPVSPSLDIHRQPSVQREGDLQPQVLGCQQAGGPGPGAGVEGHQVHRLLQLPPRASAAAVPCVPPQRRAARPSASLAPHAAAPAVRVHGAVVAAAAGHHKTQRGARARGQIGARLGRMGVGTWEAGVGMGQMGVGMWEAGVGMVCPIHPSPPGCPYIPG